MKQHCFDVTMHFWIEEAQEGATLLHPRMVTYHVHPPAWCQDDPIVLEMQLDHLAKLQFLYEVRRYIAQGNVAFTHLKDRTDYIVRGMMTGYLWPANSQDERKAVQFGHDHARIA